MNMKNVSKIDKTIVNLYNQPDLNCKKLAIFDIDWTIIKPTDGKEFPKNENDWVWLRKSVPNVLEKYSKTHQLVFLTDQTKSWKLNMIHDMVTILNLKVVVFIAMTKKYKKGNPELFLSVFPEFDKKESFMVGDAGGSKDWSSVDFDFANNVGIQFFKPEDIFPFDEIKEIEGNFEIKMKKRLLLWWVCQVQVNLVFVRLKLPDYKLICGDIFKTQPKMIKEASKHIKNHSIIFDGTNGTSKKRKVYIDYAKENNRNVKCIWLNTSTEQSIEQIKKRKTEGGHYVPKIALYTYQKYFEKPCESEGFKLFEIKK
jgi:bifunctional polynucleotide phosphatase/kinase